MKGYYTEPKDLETFCMMDSLHYSCTVNNSRRLVSLAQKQDTTTMHQHIKIQTISLSGAFLNFHGKGVNEKKKR